MSVTATSWVWALALNPTTKLVLLALADIADESWSCCPGQDKLAEKCGLGQRMIRYHLASLVSLGLLTVEPRPGTGSGRQTACYTMRRTTHQAQGEEASGNGLPVATARDRATGNGLPLAQGEPAQASGNGLPVAHEASGNGLPATTEATGKGLPVAPQASGTPLPLATGASTDLAELVSVFGNKDLFSECPPYPGPSDEHLHRQAAMGCRLPPVSRLSTTTVVVDEFEDPLTERPEGVVESRGTSATPRKGRKPREPKQRVALLSMSEARFVETTSTLRPDLDHDSVFSKFAIWHESGLKTEAEWLKLWRIWLSRERKNSFKRSSTLPKDINGRVLGGFASRPTEPRDIQTDYRVIANGN